MVIHMEFVELSFEFMLYKEKQYNKVKISANTEYFQQNLIILTILMNCSGSYATALLFCSSRLLQMNDSKNRL